MNAPAESLSLEELENLEGLARVEFPLAQVEAGIDLVSFLADTGIFPSKGEARKMVQGGGVSLNRRKVESPQINLSSEMLLHGKYLMVQKGKKNHYLVHIS